MRAATVKISDGAMDFRARRGAKVLFRVNEEEDRLKVAEPGALVDSGPLECLIYTLKASLQ